MSACLRCCTLLAGQCVNFKRRRRHKRKEHLSRAADTELAEIGLEQRVLREMMLPQQPAEDNDIQDANQSSTPRPKPTVSSSVSSVSCCFSYLFMISAVCHSTAL